MPAPVSTRPLVAHLRDLPEGTNLEEELDRVQSEEVPKSITGRRQIIALRYYLRDVLGDAAKFEDNAPAQTNYHILVDRLMRWQERTGSPITLVSFNYDTMLEKALGDVAGVDLSEISGYAANEKLRLFKPHGSVNSGRIVVNDEAIPAEDREQA